MNNKTATFEQQMNTFAYKYDLRKVFDDFLTMSICACGRNPQTGLSYDEELYLQTIKPYAHDNIRHEFPKLFATLILEMENNMIGKVSEDILGNYFEQHFYQKGRSQFFTPNPITEFMARCLGDESTEPQRIIDPCCGSGRMLLSGANAMGKHNYFYGIDIDPMCVKMAILNLFLNGCFHTEIMCADALMPFDFNVSYRTSFFPFGIFRITNKEDSELWHLYQHSFAEQFKTATQNNSSIVPSKQEKPANGNQLTFF